MHQAWMLLHRLRQRTYKDSPQYKLVFRVLGVMVLLIILLLRIIQGQKKNIYIEQNKQKNLKKQQYYDKKVRMTQNKTSVHIFIV